MLLSLLTLCYFVFFLQQSFCLSLPRAPNVSIAPNPLPPAPPAPPLGPENYPVSGSDIVLKARRPFGQPLPRDPTIFCLASAQAQLERQEATQGDVQMPNEWAFEERGIKVLIRSPFRYGITLSLASITLGGMVQLIVGFPEFGARAGGFAVIDADELLGVVELSRSLSSATNTSTATNSTTSLSKNKALDPTNYQVPNSRVTVSLKGNPPFGSPLPNEPLIVALALAISSAAQTVREHGDVALPGLWRFEEGNIGIDVYTQLSVDCTFSVLETGLRGLVDLVTEPNGVGPVAADFTFKENGKGEVASGRLKLLGTGNAASNIVSTTVPTLIQQGKTTSVTLIGGASKTAAVDTA